MSWMSRYAKLTGLEMRTVHLGSHDGQSDYAVEALAGGRVVGKLNFSEYRGEVFIDMISVEPDMRRRGVATELLQELDRLYPENEIDWGMTTPEGELLRKRYMARHPKPLEFQGGLSDREFAIESIPGFGRFSGVASWLDSSIALSLAGIDLDEYDLSWEPDRKRLLRDAGKVPAEKWAAAAKRLRRRLGIDTNAGIAELAGNGFQS